MEQARRNASFDYNISSCVHPDGWRIGTEKWRYYAGLNESSLEAQRSTWRADPLWEYDDVVDETILNCTCTFLNETFDPNFVAAVIEYEMRPAVGNKFLSNCLCLYNATANEPQHCVHSNFSNIMNIFDWVFGNRSQALAPIDYVTEHSATVVDCAINCFHHCLDHCGAYFVEHSTPKTRVGTARATCTCSTRRCAGAASRAPSTDGTARKRTALIS